MKHVVGRRFIEKVNVKFGVTVGIECFYLTMGSFGTCLNFICDVGWFTVHLVRFVSQGMHLGCVSLHIYIWV